MAHREGLTGQALRLCFGTVRKGVTPKRLLRDICEELASAQRDMDITGDMDAHCYYEGMVDAYNTVAQWIAPFKNQDRYHELLGFKSPAEIEANIKAALAAAKEQAA